MDRYIQKDPIQLPGLDKIYMDYFGYKENGFFVDIGAYDGMNFSNTYCLAEAGWEGICYEPVPESYKACINNHKNHKVKSIQTCIGDRKGTVQFTIPRALTISTYSDYYKNSQYWKNDYYYSYAIESPIITLDESLRENNVKPNFDVLSLDVEGSETDVLKFFDVEYWKPKMAIVEAQELHPALELRNQAPFINMFFEEAGYEKIYCDEINNIYVLPLTK
jgi:FkbM family methyltransferase